MDKHGHSFEHRYGESLNAIPREDEVLARLSQDGQSWRSQLSFTDKTVKEVLEKSASTTEVLARGSSMQTGGGSPMYPQHAQSHKKAFSPRSFAYAGATAVALIALLIVLFTRVAHSSSPTTGFAPPPFFRWTPVHNSARLTAQAAFAEGVELTPCYGHPPQSKQIDWIATNSHFGLAIIQIACPNQMYLMVFGMAKDAAQMWIPAPQYCVGRSGSIDPRHAAVVPSWLPLPAGLYDYAPASGAGQLPILVDTWYTSTQIYFTGQLNEQVDIPPQAAEVQIDGREGFMVQDTGLVHYLVPLAPGKTFVFASTAAPQEAQPLATAALMHLPELLSPPYNVG